MIDISKGRYVENEMYENILWIMLDAIKKSEYFSKHYYVISETELIFGKFSHFAHLSLW
jgi:hypothetical protein